MPHERTTTEKQPHAKPFLWRNPARVILLFALSVFCLTLSPAVVLAENNTAPITHALNAPQRGESMTSVKTRLGAPLEKLATVGTPPITRWVYKDFTVYFEYERVIHSTPNSIKPAHRP